MKKLFKILADNSNALLIFTTMIALVTMINMSVESSRKAGQNLVYAVSVYTEILNPQTPMPSPETVKKMVDQFSGKYFGWDKKDVSLALKTLHSASEATDEQKVMQLITSYQNLNLDRLQSFSTLLYFLSATALIQFIFLIVTTHKAQLTGEKLRNSEQVLKLLNSEREQERLRISSFLHDSILQEMESLLMSPEMKKIDSAAERLMEISENLRELTYQLTPLQLNTTGLKDAINDLVFTFKQNDDANISFSSDGYHELMLDNEQRLVFYRIAQESLMNIRKHAEATHIEVKLAASSPFVTLRISDNGKGLNNPKTAENEHEPKHIGMLLMREQAKSIGALLTGETTPGRRTTITLKYRIKKS